MEQLLSEFDGLSLGDARLDRRALKIITKLQEKASESFPAIFENDSELEGFYRFVENPYVRRGPLLDPHIAASIRRAERSGDVIVAHDTTEYVFTGRREGLSESDSWRSTSFFGHTSLAFKANNLEPLGVVRLKTWTRSDEPSKTQLRKAGLPQGFLQYLPSEQDRWFESIRETAELFEQPNSLIHVCDSEGDDYRLLDKINAESFRCVIRAFEDRRIADTEQKIFEFVAQKPILAERVVMLSERSERSPTKKRNQKRKARVAKLEIRSAEIKLCRPKTLSEPIPKTVDVNVVHVFEKNPPADEPPTEWLLYTSEPIASTEQVLSVVDIYRARWGIEEYFKALKTGCSYETRQLESYKTLDTCLALFTPIAWLMLLLRWASRTTPDAPAKDILRRVTLDVLRLETGKAIKTAQEALLAVAKLGGHIKNNGAPGWLVLWRGCRKLALLERGYLHAKTSLSEKARKRCDQS